MKIYVAMNALPWEKFTIAVPDPTKDDGSLVQVKAASSPTRAGFLPIFWRKEDALKAFPDATVAEAEVPDDWHPMLNQMQDAAKNQST